MKCDVCGKPESVGVASSCLGPMSNSYCQECACSEAEPFWMFVYTFYEVGHEGEGIADWVRDLRTFKDGQYMTWDEFAQFEKQNDFPNRPPPYDEYIPYDGADEGPVEDLENIQEYKL